MAPPRVFISYAQYAPEHSARVRELAEALLRYGIDADLDQFHQHELLDWPRWCQERLRPEHSDWVLMVCSTAYRDRIKNRVDPHTGKGAFWEGTFIDDQLYQAKGNSRFVPVLLDDEPEDAIPSMVRGWTWFRVRGLGLDDSGFEALYRLLTGQPAFSKPPVGELADLGTGSPAPMPSPRPCPRSAGTPAANARIHARAVGLLEAFFANDNEGARRTVFNLAFGGCERDPRGSIVWTGSAIEFADRAVERLLVFGCSDRGRHSLSLLLTTMVKCRGRQTDPDYSALPPLLDAPCALPTRDEEMAYLDRLLAEIEEKARLYAPLRGIADIKPADQAEALLAPWGDDEDIALLMHRPRKRAGAEEGKHREYEDILIAFGDVKQATLLGAPGAGKSTTLRRLTADLARSARADQTASLPILVNLGDWRGDEALSSFLAERAPEIGWAVDALSMAGRLVLLLDGLNEVPTAKRKAKAEDLLALRNRLAKGTPCIVSCRKDDYVGDLDLGLDTLSLEPLSPQRIRQVLRHWLPDHADGVEPGSAERLFWQFAGDERLAGVLKTWLETGATEDTFWSVADPKNDEQVYAKTSRNEDEIWRRNVPNPRSLLRLAANPFMLTMLYQVWAFEGELPRNRGDLFTRFIDRLLRREKLLKRDKDTAKWQRDARADLLLDGLANVAEAMQVARRVRHYAEGEDEAEDFGVLTVLARREVVRLLDDASLLKIAEDATLLETTGTDLVRFRHQLLQEYFTAIALRQYLMSGGLEARGLWHRERWWERSGWEESAVLLAGLYSDDCTPVIRWLEDAQPEVAPQCILESGAEITDRDGLFHELRDAWLPRLTDLDRDPSPEARAAVGRALGRLGLDDRKGVGLDASGLPDIDWVEILGGEFIYQDGERGRIEPFHIARYPVTNAQFQAFLNAEDGYADDRWWRDLAEPDRNPAQPRWEIPNHPRETVSWFEATAFCAWLSDRTGLEIRLPTEWEWERAARGTDGRAYPWGTDYRAGRANIDETWGDAGPHNLGRTSAVGIYPRGTSPEGAMDLSGNVWEWCLNEYGNPDGIQAGGDASRVLRGGSWDDDQGCARAGARFDLRPRARSVNHGFRVLCASPIR